MARREETREARKTSAKRVKFCPKCGSKNIFWAQGLAQLWSIWECRNCGYYGAFIVEDGKLAEKLQEEYSKKLTEHKNLEVQREHSSHRS